MTLEEILEAASKPAENRTARYTARLEDRLAKYSSDLERLLVLRRELAVWEGRYQQWIIAVDSGRLQYSPGAPTATDYLLTISEISSRIVQLEHKLAASEPAGAA